MIDFVLRTAGSYPVLFALCATSGIIPLPEDVPALVAGMSAASGHTALGPTIVVAFVGVMCRDLLFYGLGRRLSSTVLDRPLVRRVVGGPRIERARALIGARGAQAVLIGRFLVGFRTPVFLTAGALGVPLKQFLFWDLVGGVVMVPGMVLLGYFFGEPALDALQWVLDRSWVAVLLLALGLAGGWWLRRPRVAADEA